MAKSLSSFKKCHPETKIIFDIFDLYPEQMPKLSNTTVAKIWANLRNKSLKKVDFVILECYFYQKQLENFLNDNKNEVLYLNRSEMLPSTNNVWQDKQIDIAYLGSINWHGVDFLADKETYLDEFPKVVYTGMIDAFFDYKHGELEYRSVRFESETFDSDNVQGNAVINYTDAETPFTRVMEWRHFDQKADAGKSILTKGYPQDWDRTKEAYYPVNDEKNSDLFKAYRRNANALKQVIFGGRLGNYQYYDMDQVFNAALKVVKKEFGE